MRTTEKEQEALALWAADCAERVLPLFENQCCDDNRPREAIEAVREWVRGALAVGNARASSLAAHRAARDAANDPASRAAARAAGHAAAVAHVAGHARHAAAYAVKAVSYAAGTADAIVAAAKERAWQIQHLPEYLRPVLFPGDD